MKEIIIENLTKCYGKACVLDDISFTVAKGDVLAILGGSGGGKSTLLRCMNLLEIPNQGNMQVGDVRMAFPYQNKRRLQQTMQQLRTQVGMVFQQFNLWPHMTVLENLIEAPYRVLGKQRDTLMHTAEQLLTQLGLTEKRHIYPALLSGGQQQRVAIARALMMQPDIMLFDEPTSSLDPEMSREILSIMRQLVAEGMTICIATHEINFAREVASHVLFMDAGKVVEFGEAAEVFTTPKSVRFKKFLESGSQSER